MTPLTALYMAEHCFDNLPAGVVNVITGFGTETGEPLVKHRDVPVIAFTGNLATGQRIASNAAPMMKKLHLELGGEDATAIAEDAGTHREGCSVCRADQRRAGLHKYGTCLYSKVKGKAIYRSDYRACEIPAIGAGIGTLN
jgi:acyl-CoA reductase-like NAD-dependent aldehyde dehydrogenase